MRKGYIQVVQLVLYSQLDQVAQEVLGAPRYLWHLDYPQYQEYPIKKEVFFL